MALTLEQIRKKNSDFESLNDDELFAYLSENSYPNIAPAVLAEKVGYYTPEQRGRGILSDTKTALKQGVERIPGALAGAGDIAAGLSGFDRPFSRIMDAAGEVTGFQPEKWATNAESEYSPAMQESQANIDAIWQNPNSNFIDKAKAYAQNPRATYKNVIRSLPEMAAGGILARELQALGAADSLAIGAGEGAVMAGDQMVGIDKSVDPELAAKVSLVTGAGGALLGMAGNKISKMGGFGDIDELALKGGFTTGIGTGGATKRIIGGMVTEGPIEEGSQSALETASKNYAEGKPLTEGMARNVAEGSIAGSVMGGTVASKTAGQRDAETNERILNPNASIDDSIAAMSESLSAGTPQSSGVNAGINAGGYEQTFQDAANHYGIPVDFLKAIAQQESGMRQFDKHGNPVSPGTSTAIGMMQIIPNFFRKYDARKLANDPEYNINAGAEILSDLIRNHEGDLSIAAKRYYGSKDDAANQRYADSVLGKMNGAIPIAKPTTIQGRSNGIIAKAKFGGDRLISAAGLESLNNGTDITSSADGAINTSPDEGSPNVAWHNTKMFSNIANSKPFIIHGFSGLDIPSQRAMLAHVAAFIQDGQISDDIVQSIPVNVMNYLTIGQGAANSDLNHSPVLKDSLSVNNKISIPIAVQSTMDRIIPSINAIALARTKKHTSDIPGYVTGSSINDGVTSSTIDGRHSITPNSNVGLGGMAVGAALSPSILSKNTHIDDTLQNKSTNARQEQSLPATDNRSPTELNDANAVPVGGIAVGNQQETTGANNGNISVLQPDTLQPQQEQAPRSSDNVLNVLADQALSLTIGDNVTVNSTGKVGEIIVTDKAKGVRVKSADGSVSNWTPIDNLLRITPQEESSHVLQNKSALKDGPQDIGSVQEQEIPVSNIQNSGSTVLPRIQGDINTKGATQEGRTGIPVPEILSVKKLDWVKSRLNGLGVKKGSPGYVKRMIEVGNGYDDELAKAQVSLPFNEYKALPDNKGQSENVLRQSYGSLRNEYGFNDATAQPQDIKSSATDVPDQAQDGVNETATTSESQLNKLPSVLRQLAENAKGLTKEEFINKVQDGLNNQNLTKREFAQNVMAHLRVALKTTPDVFYDDYIANRLNKGPVNKTPKSEHDKADVSKKGENVDTLEGVADKVGTLYSKSVPSEDVDFAHEILTGLSEVDEMFRFPISKATTLPAVMKDIAPAFKYIGEDTHLDKNEDFGAEKKLLFKNEQGKPFDVYVRGNELWIDISRFETGEKGSSVYAAVGNYAFNTGNVFIADPHSLSDDAAIRRTSAMLSLALRFGGTDFMEPGPKQLKGIPELGVKPLKWTGNDVDRTKALIDTFLSNLEYSMPELKNVRYDFNKRDFLRRSDNLPVDWGKMDNARAAGFGVKARAGEATARRGVFIRSLISSESSQRPGILEQVLNRGRPLVKNGNLRGVFSKSTPTTGSTIAQVKSWLPARVGKLVASGKLEVVQSVHDLPEYLQQRGTALYHVAFHGSPHDHNKFDSSKIGTGEGAQAFGYGHYFTDAKDIAEWYRDQLSSMRAFSFDGTDKLTAKELRDRIIAKYGVKKLDNLTPASISDEVVSDIIRGVKDNPFRVGSNNAAFYDELYSAINYDNKATGKLYNVELAPTQDEYLDWDKPLSGQSGLVKSVYETAFSNPPDGIDRYNWKKSLSDAVWINSKIENRAGGTYIYSAVSNALGSDKTASEYLHSLGIRGIRYKADGGKSDANNYVIFDDSDISITTKYSQGLTGVEALYDTGRDRMYLVADMLNKDNIKPVVAHELTHRALATDPKLKAATAKFDTGLQNRFNLAAKGIGTPLELAAYKRVVSAKTPLKDQMEEFKGYINTEYTKNPDSFTGKLKRIFDDFIAAIRMALVRNGLDFGYIKTLTPADLFAMSKYGAKVNSSKISSSSGVLASSRGEESNNIRFSRASDVIAKAKDFVSGNDRNVNSLSDIDAILATGKMPKDNVDMQSILDKAATLFVDSSRPFDTWTRKLNNQIRAGELIFAKDRAKRRTAIFEKQAMDDYLRPLAKVIDNISKNHNLDYRAAKELAGQWMTARYAIEKNNDYIRQDQKSVDEAQAALDDKLEQDKKDLAQGKIDSQPANGGLKSALTKAQNKQQERLSAIHGQRRIDPSEESLGVGLAGGYNNFTAELYMSAIEDKIPRAELETAANHVYDMLAWKLDKDLENGKVTQAMVDTWQNSRYYVPLTGDPSVDESDDPLFSHGSLNQQSDKKAEGRKGSIAQNGIDAATEQVQKSARYHGWLDFKDKFTEIYDELIQTELDNGLTQREAQREVSDTYGIDRSPETGLTRPSDSGLVIRKDGKGWVYDINDTTAMDALRSVNKEDVPSILQPIAFFTRSYARMVTQFLPGFGVINAIRDTWERSENIRTRALPGYESLDMDKVAKEAIRTASNPKLIKKLMGVMFEGTKLESKFSVDESDPDIKIIREMIKEGGTSTVGDYLNSTSATLAKQMKDSLKLSTEAMNVISAWNNSFELVSSYSIYKALRSAGVDEKIAASGTLNLMNFGKQGTLIGPLKALYVFTNPAMQGGHQMLMTLGTKKGKARAAAYLIAGTVLYTMLRAGDDDDETGINRTDQLGNFVLERNIPIKIPGTNEYVKIPIGFGMPQAMWATAVNVSKFMFGDQSAVDSGAEILKSFARTLAPVQPSETSISKHPLVWMTQTFSPQVIKPMVNIALDVNTFGSPLTNSRFQKPDVSNALQGRKSTPEEYKEIAQELAKFGIDLYPEQVREIIKGYAVGPMNEITKAAIENPHKEKLGRDTISPMFDRYMATQDASALKERLYYRYRDEMNEAAVKESVGEALSPREEQLAKLVVTVKKLENKANGKMAAATKQEKGKNDKFKSPYRKQAESIRESAMKIVFNKMKALSE